MGGRLYSGWLPFTPHQEVRGASAFIQHKDWSKNRYFFHSTDARQNEVGYDDGSDPVVSELDGESTVRQEITPIDISASDGDNFNPIMPTEGVIAEEPPESETDPDSATDVSDEDENTEDNELGLKVRRKSTTWYLNLSNAQIADDHFESNEAMVYDDERIFKHLSDRF